MNLELLSGEFIICQMDSGAHADLSRPFTFLSVTDEETSLVCLRENAPACALKREEGYCCLRVQGVLDFSLTGILSHLSGLLAEAKIPLFALSTWNTDYILIRQHHLSAAWAAFEKAGHCIVTAPKSMD